MIMRVQRFLLLVLLLMPMAGPGAWAQNITGAGASLPFPVYATWAAHYHQLTNKQVNYQSIGSGGGQQQIIVGTVAFGATDDPMSGPALKQHDLFQFPAVIGGIVPVVNIEGVGPGELKLSGALLADIYLGKITRWNDPAITALNPELQLPARTIVVVHRSDGSGTTFNWSDYLAKVSPEWRSQVGVGKAIKWPIGQGGKGNEGVAAYVSQLKDSIGYLEFSYAVQNDLSWTLLQNKSGAFVAPTEASFSAAAAHADWSGTPGMGVVLTDQAGADSWPITTASFILLKKVQRNRQQGQAVLRFFEWAFTTGREIALSLDYVPLPDEVVEQVETLWAQELRTNTGQPLWPLGATTVPAGQAESS